MMSVDTSSISVTFCSFLMSGLKACRSQRTHHNAIIWHRKRAGGAVSKLMIPETIAKSSPTCTKRYQYWLVFVYHLNLIIILSYLGTILFSFNVERILWSFTAFSRVIDASEGLGCMLACPSSFLFVGDSILDPNYPNPSLSADRSDGLGLGLPHWVLCLRKLLL